MTPAARPTLDRGVVSGPSVWLWILMLAVPGRLAAQPAEPPPPASAARAPLVHAIEVGASLGGYDSGLGPSNDQSVRYRLSRVGDFSFVVDGGHEHRFNDDAARVTVGISKTLRSGPTVSAWWTAGTGKVIAPRYRLDFGVMQDIGGVLTTVTFTRVQSKVVNASDGVTVSAVRYFPRWIVTGIGRIEIGSPGRKVSPSVGFGATWYRWKQLYIGGDINWGRVSYLLLPNQPVAVDYQSVTGGVLVSRWFNDHSGLNVRGTFGSTDIYRTGGVIVSLFREF